MELQPSETAVIYGTDNCGHINMFPQIRKKPLQPAAHPFSPLIDVIYSTDFYNIIQNRINALLSCLAWNQPLFGYAPKNFPGFLS